MNNAEFLWQALIVIVALGNAVTAWMVLTGRGQKRILSPQPFITKAAVENTPMRDHEHLVIRVEKLEQRIDKLASSQETHYLALIAAGQERADQLRGEITRSSSNLHKRVDDVLKAVSRLEGIIND